MKIDCAISKIGYLTILRMRQFLLLLNILSRLVSIAFKRRGCRINIIYINILKISVNINTESFSML